jgi:glucan phosphoethanolaminetransferase (alkaline phosphatase superfamily)
MDASKKDFNPLKLMILVFVLLSAFFLIFRETLTKAGADANVLIIANIILFLIGIFTVRNGLKAVSNPNPHVFVRVFYTGFIIRLFACAIAAFVYIYWTDGKVNKVSLFGSLGIYILYNIIEVSSLQKALRNNKNG